MNAASAQQARAQRIVGIHAFAAAQALGRIYHPQRVFRRGVKSRASFHRAAKRPKLQSHDATLLPRPYPPSTPRLTDRPALLRHRARAQAGGTADWLHRLVIDEVQDRLGEINRRFTDTAVVTGMPAPWREAFPDARIVADDPALDLVPQAHDLVIHALALHWADDPVGQLVQCAPRAAP